MKSKRGGENLTLQSIMTLIFVVLLFAAMVLFLVNNATGSLVKKQILAKQLCLVMTMSNPGTDINVSFSGIIEKNGNGFLIKKDKVDLGYYYPCYNTNFNVIQDGKYYTVQVE